jgi:Rhs element Vgr protein
MSETRTIPTTQTTDQPSVELICNGETLPLSIPVLSILVSKSFNKISRARIHVQNGDSSAEDFPISNEDYFAPGSEIEVKAGYHSENETIFKGLVIAHKLKIQRDKPSVIIIECRDASYQMTLAPKNAYFFDSTDQEIIDEIAGAYSMDTELVDTSVSHPQMVQYYSTDWDFCVLRAEANGKVILPDDGTLKMLTPSVEGSVALELLFGATILEFDGEIDARIHNDGYKVKSWDYATQKVSETESQYSSEPEIGYQTTDELAGFNAESEMLAQSPGVKLQEEMQELADALAMKDKLSKLKGRIQLLGYPAIKPGDVVQLGGLGDRMNGLTLVSGIRHEISNGTFTTNLQVGLSPDWHFQTSEYAQKPSSGLLPNVNGLHIAIVTALEGDPNGEHRIQIKDPLIDPDSEGIWARVSTLDAGDNRGSFFRPEIEDEVLVGFLNDDPRDPVVLGMLNSSAKPAPSTEADDNHEKGFQTRSGMKVWFNDDEVSMLLETPNGNKVWLSEDEGALHIEDENSNLVHLTSDGISMESSADINITASGDVNIEGTNVTVSASAQFSASGSAGAEVSSDGSTTIGGSIVQIN